MVQMSRLPQTGRERLRVRRGERKTANRVRVLEVMLRQIWRGYRRQVSLAYPELNPRYMFLYEGRVFRIRPKALYILTPVHYQSFLEIRNTAWCVTVPLPEYTMAMSKWIKEGIDTELVPNDRDFKKLTWIPREFDDNLPVPSAEAHRHANLSKRDPGHVMWWTHNGLQIQLTLATNWMNQCHLSHLRHLWLQFQPARSLS